jgi:kynureninase
LVSSFSADRSYAQTLDAADQLAHFRDRFVRPNWDDLIYLNGNSLGPLPVRTQARIAELIDQDWGVGLVRSWDKWIHLPRQAGDMVGEQLVGAASGQVIVCDSVTVNLYKLAWAALDFRPGRDVIVTDDDNFPTDRYVLQGVAAQRGCELRMIHSDMDDGVSEESLVAALDDRVALVELSHVAYRSGALADMARLTELIHRAGALALWDLCHSVGAVPVELDGSGADLAVGCTYKYVNAGPGAPALLYVRDELQHQLRQPIWGWFGQRDQFEMGPRYDPAPGIGAFLTGTPDIIGAVAVEEGARLLAEAGMPQLRRKSVALTEYLIALADEWLAPLGFTVASPRPASRRGGHVTLRHDDARQLSQALMRTGVISDYRTPDRIRLSAAPLYTSFTHVWDGLDRLREIAASKSYTDIPPEQPLVS